MSTATYLERLGARTAASATVLCLGVDPDPASLPHGFSSDLAGVERFVEVLLDAALARVAAVKPNLAFFEAFGSQGIAALERLRTRIPPDVPVVVDAKRGDIGSTAARQAVALFDLLGADAVTVSPYLGSEAIAPLLERAGRFAYVLCRTSNPGAGELQDLQVAADGEATWPEEPLHVRVARRVRLWNEHYGTAGLVVGATAPRELAVLRGVAPDLAFLVPGVGAQGGDADGALTSGRAISGDAGSRAGGGLLVNVSRGIAGAAKGAGDPAEAIAAAADEWARRLPVLQSRP